MKQESRFRKAKNALIFWCLFIGLGAVAGAVGMLADPSGKAMGMDALLPCFQVLPFAEIVFQNFVFSGFALLVVNGLTNLTAAALLFLKKDAGVICGMIFGVTLMLWICIQFVIFPLNFMSTIYFIFGLIQALTGYAAWVFCRQERFSFSEADYPHVGEKGTELVVYFSRMGYTRKLAYETAEATGAAIYEIKATERTEGTAGFWWCGRFGMHRWPMPIEEISAPLERYEKVTICSPIWVFALSSPVRRFCMEASGRIRRADYILVHHQKSSYENAAAEMDRLLGLVRGSAVSVCCRKGRYLQRRMLSPGATKTEEGASV